MRSFAPISVLNINIGIDRPKVSDQHWIYFPEESVHLLADWISDELLEGRCARGHEFDLYRDHAPRSRRCHVEECVERSIQDLQNCGILRKDDRILTRQILDIPYAYVVFDEHRHALLQSLIDISNPATSSRPGVTAAGSISRWESISDGKSAAEAVAAKLGKNKIAVLT